MSQPEMKIKSIAPWFGGKRILAPTIVEELGPHTQYFEPFCGSLAILLAKKPSQKETVADLHGDLINLARTVQRRSSAEELYDRLARALVCEALLDDARAYLEDPDHILDGEEISLERAYWYFLASWLGRSGTAGVARQDYQISVRWTKSGGSPTVRFYNATESLPAWHRRLRNVVILRRDAFEFLHRFEDVPETVIYVDPPYVEDSRSGILRRPESRYLHEFSHTAGNLPGFRDDHDRLNGILAQYKRARIVVSYYDCPRVRALYAGWTIVEHRCVKVLQVQSRRGERGAERKDAPELLLINGPSYAAELQR